MAGLQFTPVADSLEERRRVREAQNRALINDPTVSVDRKLAQIHSPSEVWTGPQKTQILENLAAGVYDVAAAVPLLSGLAGAGIEAGVDEVFGSGPQNFSDNLSKRLGQGLNAVLFNAGVGGIEAIDDFVGVPHQ